MPWLNKRWISFFSLSAAAFVVIIAVVGWVNTNEAIKRQSTVDSFGTIPDGDINNNFATNWTQPFVLACLVTVNSFDVNSNTGPAIGVSVKYFPANNLISESKAGAPNVGIQVIVQGSTFKFSANNTFPSQNMNLIAPGNSNNYPFDRYTGSIQISASVQQSGESVPLTIYAVGAVQGFSYSSQFLSSQDGSDVALGYEFRRSNTTRLFSAIVFILLWLLSLSIFTAAMSVWFREKNVEPGLISISTALLFALPNVRNSQPGVPPIVGTTEDMSGFFWNLLLVGISAISLLVKYILQNKRPAPRPVISKDSENGEKPTALNPR